MYVNSFNIKSDLIMSGNKSNCSFVGRGSPFRIVKML